MESVTRFRAQIRSFKRVNQSDCLLLWNHLEIGLLTTMTNKVGEQWVFRCSGLDANRLRAQQLQRDGKEEKKKTNFGHPSKTSCPRSRLSLSVRPSKDHRASRVARFTATKQLTAEPESVIFPSSLPRGKGNSASCFCFPCNRRARPYKALR